MFQSIIGWEYWVFMEITPVEEPYDPHDVEDKDIITELCTFWKSKLGLYFFIKLQHSLMPVNIKEKKLLLKHEVCMFFK